MTNSFLKAVLTICLVSYQLMSVGQSTDHLRFEAQAGGGIIQLPEPYRNGWAIRQQLTGYVRPRVGLSLGLTWANSANLGPVVTEPGSTRPDPIQLPTFYQRTEQMTDLSVAALPLLTQRHQVKLQAGLSIYRRRESTVDSIIYLNPSNYATILNQTSINRVVPMVAASYDFRLSNRWSVGINGAAYFYNAGATTTTLGLHGAYRFGLIADSLGLAPIRWDELKWGVRAAGNIVSRNGDPENWLYRTRFVGGVWAELPLSLTWSVRGELNYAQRGFRTREGRQSVATSDTTRLGNANYLELPLLFRHEVAYRWYIYSGPYLAFFLNGESDGKRNPRPQSHTVSGLMLGSSYNLTDQLAADLRYQRDMITISSSPYGGFHSFQVGLTYSFRKKP